MSKKSLIIYIEHVSEKIHPKAGVLLPAYMYVVRRGQKRSEEGIRSPGIGVKDSLGHHVVLGIGPGSSTITVEPSLQPLV